MMKRNAIKFNGHIDIKGKLSTTTVENKTPFLGTIKSLSHTHMPPTFI